MKRKYAIKRFLLCALFVVTCYSGLELYRRRPREEIQEPEVPRPIRTMSLSEIQKTGTRKYFGTVKGSQRVNLSFRVAGQLTSLRDRGEKLRRGELIAQLDPRDYNVRLRNAQSQVNQTQAELAKAQNDFRRYSGLYESKTVSEFEYDRYKTAYEVARANFQASQASLREAQNALADTKLTAPFDCFVAERFVENHQEVQAKQSIVSLQNLASLEIVFNIPEKDMTKALGPGESLSNVRVAIDALPGQIFAGVLKEYALQADAVTQTYAVTVTIPQDESGAILAGMAAVVELDIQEPAGAQRGFLVPNHAILQDDQGRNWVWKIDGGKARKISVEARFADEENSSVQGDLRPGDLIATAGVHFLREGREVIPMVPVQQ